MFRVMWTPEYGIFPSNKKSYSLELFPLSNRMLSVSVLKYLVVRSHNSINF